MLTLSPVGLAECVPSSFGADGVEGKNESASTTLAPQEPPFCLRSPNTLYLSHDDNTTARTNADSVVHYTHASRDPPALIPPRSVLTPTFPPSHKPTQTPTDRPPPLDTIIFQHAPRTNECASCAKPTGAAYAQAREQEKQRKKAIRDQRRAAEAATREEDAELAAQMKASARLNGEVRQKQLLLLWSSSAVLAP